MTFSLSTSLTHINIDESCIIDIYRSIGTATPRDPMYQGHPCEAYLCTGRENNLLLAYIAILDTATRTPFIFTADCDAKDTAACGQLVTEANTVIGSMGFTLERVNIDYGIAMRQVVIRNLCIMRPPQRTTTSPPKEQVLEKKKTPPPPLHAAASPQPSAGDTALGATPDPSVLSSLKAACERLAREKADAEAAAEQTIADLTERLAHAETTVGSAEKSRQEDQRRYRQALDSMGQEIATLRSELKIAAEARTGAEETLTREIDRRREGEARAAAERARLEAALEEERTRHAASATCLHEAEAHLQTTRDELEVAGKRRIEAEATATARLAEEIAQRRESEAWAAAELARLGAALEEERDRLATAEIRLHGAEASLQKAGNNLETETRQRVEAESAAKKRERSMRKEPVALREEGTAAAELLREREEQCRTLRAECDHLRARLSEVRDMVRPEQAVNQGVPMGMGEAERLKEANRALSDRLEEVRKEHDLAMQAVEAELCEANAGLESLAADVERLSSEKRSWDIVSAAFKKKVRSAVERLRKEKLEIENELQRLREQVAGPPFHLSPGTPGAAETAIPRSLVIAEADAQSPRAGTGHAMGTSLGSSCSAFRSGDAVFRYDPKLSTISCTSPEEIMEIHGSINAIQAGPFGRRPQVCRAYVLGVRHGRKVWIYLAWLLQDERAVLVCRPEKQPENAAAYGAMIRDALFYFESTGFMMDRFDLSKRLRPQLKVLEEGGICRFGTHQAPRTATA